MTGTFLLLLFHALTNVESLIMENNHNTSACQATQVRSNTTGQLATAYSCIITPENEQEVLENIRLDHVVSLSLEINERFSDFVFGNESFSKDLESLTISSYFPMLISSGTFMGSNRIYQLSLSQKYYLEAVNVNNTNATSTVTKWTSLQLKPGWLRPIPGLTELSLSSNRIEGFPDMIFCTLKVLRILDLSNNLLKSCGWLGIKCNNSVVECYPCLPNVVELNLYNNPIRYLNVNISDDLPLLKILDISGCTLSSIDLSAVLSPNLEVLALFRNEISSLVSSNLWSCNSSLNYLYLGGNRLRTIPGGIFRCLNHLTDVHLYENLLSEDTLIAASVNSLVELTILNLDLNNISTLSAELIGNMVSLVRFSCDGCGLRGIKNDTFINLINIQWLTLDNNNLHSIDGSTFTHLINLYQLTMRNNLLVAIPDFTNPLPKLSELILDGNRISEIEPDKLSRLAYRLQKLSLAFNQIKYIPHVAFSKMHFLQDLNLNSNMLKTLEYNKAYSHHLLQTLSLSGNLLATIPSMVLELKYLEFIDLSWNRITIVQLGKPDPLKMIDLSFNNITKFESPLSTLINLLWINLTNNNLRDLNEDDFLTPKQPRPQVLLQGNPLHCDCQMEWLLKTKFNRPYEEKWERKFQDTKIFNPTINNFEDAIPFAYGNKRFYADVPDLDLLECRTSGSDSVQTPLIRTDFLCPYAEECTDWGCYEDCCTQDTDCPCRGFCYPNCLCYHKNNHRVDFMNCTSRNVTSLPHRGPIYAKQIYLDGNNLTHLSLDHLDFPELTELFLNKSNIFSLQNSVFKKLQMLEILHLEHNHLEKIEPDTFTNVFKLKELYLQDNNIVSIENESFLDLSYLNTLKLHGNNLEYLNFSLIEGLKLLTELTLHDNPWFCDCDTGPVLQAWLIKHHDIVTDLAQVHCSNNSIYTDVLGTKSDFGEEGARNIHLNLTNKPLIHIDFSKICTKVEKEYIKSITELAALAVVFCLFLLIVILVYKNLLLIKMCLYNQCGLRFHREENDNVERPYDVFLTYPRQDDVFIVQHLLPELEFGDMSYKICLEGRDWPPGADKAETFIASVQQSKRTLLLVSEHHFNAQWCEFTFEAAHYQVLMDKKIRLIIILMDRNLEAQMNRAMKMYIRTNTYLVVGEKWFWKKLRYYLADNPRGADEDVGRDFALMRVYDNQAP